MENKKVCKACGGRCCKQMGCHYSPEDFKEITYDALKKEIDKGYISIDWWEGDPFCEGMFYFSDIDRVYYLRVRNVGANIIDPSWGGRCSLLTDEGCSLSYKDRPKGGRELIPKEDMTANCESKYSKQDSAKEWYKYKDILTKLVKYYKEGN